ncbi:MAG: hypothetical protein SCABRO_03134 [Candidatus Scalindua brodae]|uniref:Uncharacterized protein n=1 Tax=Candidatus Scalindua brodae TaxID=237368 RepID=A0A0B0ED45_9BACT|nr:MAG: hypothetical protein SCABRO_03134 [Candidatus Scalindua brodae]
MKVLKGRNPFQLEWPYIGLIQMSGPFMFSVVINCVGGIKSLCKTAEVSDRCVEDKMEMIFHENIPM